MTRVPIRAGQGTAHVLQAPGGYGDDEGGCHGAEELGYRSQQEVYRDFSQTGRSRQVNGQSDRIVWRSRHGDDLLRIIPDFPAKPGEVRRQWAVRI